MYFLPICFFYNKINKFMEIYSLLYLKEKKVFYPMIWMIFPGPFMEKEHFIYLYILVNT